MGTAERKKRDKIRRREQIVDAAEKVFFSKGFSSATMDEIAEAAELGKGTLYLYFANKEDLYFAVNLRGFEIMNGLFKEAATEAENGLQAVLTIGRAYVRFYREYTDYFNALLYYESQVMEENMNSSVMKDCDQEGHEGLEILMRTLQNGINDGSIRPDIDIPKTAVALWGQTTGIIQLVSSKGSHLEKSHHLDMNDIINYSFEMMTIALKNIKKEF